MTSSPSPGKPPVPGPPLRAINAWTHLLAGLLPSLAAAGGEFPAPFNTEASATHPRPAALVATNIALPPGFRVTVFAAEPDVQQPIAMTTDPRGRLWVAENYTYSEAKVGFHAQLRDRIVVFEDTDQDGRFDRRTVFWDGAERLTSIEVGLGGVWAIALPRLLFLPDANGDDLPDGPPQVLLDGFEFQNARHTVANGLRWGPDGWLYGRQGILGTSHIGAPGTTEPNRVSLNVGIWRFHPIRRVFEVVAEGTTNPWGMDWDPRGEPFFINTVIGHLWHVIPGAHYRRMFGEDPNPHVYESIEQHADHVHWATNEVWTDVRKSLSGATLDAGGGHAHTGLLIYQGGQWPPEWNGRLLTINLHGRKLNVERLEPAGSGFVGRREPDAFAFPDPWFRGIDLIAAPDGGVFVSDWSDAGECHDHDGIHRLSGRIYRISHGPPPSRPSVDLTRLGDLELVALQDDPNEWRARQARRVLADRARLGQPIAEARTELRNLTFRSTNEVTRLRALWALHSAGYSHPGLLFRKLSGSPAERIWAVRLLEDVRHTHAGSRQVWTNLVQHNLPRLAATEASAPVRLALASLLQRLPPPQRVALANSLLAHSEDAEDHNLPLMLWYGIEPLRAQPASFLHLLTYAQLPRTQRLGARRIAEDVDTAPQDLDALVQAAAGPVPPATRRALLDGIADGLAGRRKVPPPASWAASLATLKQAADAPLLNRIRDLGALFGDGRALDEIRVIALDPTSDLARRRAALLSLIEARATGLREICEKLLPTRDLSGAAARGLALFDEPAVAERLLEEWPRLYGHERAPVLNALLSRPAWARLVLEAIARNRLRASDLGVYQARQILAFRQPDLTRRLTEVWGTLQETTDTARQATQRRWREKLVPAALAAADPMRGRDLYAKSCGQCHRLYGSGGEIGPDLTGAGRQNADYLLENILFPSAVVPADYRQVMLELADGRSLSGIVRARHERTLTLQSIGETSILQKSDIKSEQTSALSLMPDGLLEGLTEPEVMNLFAYLMSQAPPPTAPETNPKSRGIP